MKTLTEFSTVMLRRGAAVRAAKTTEGVPAEAMAEAIATAITVPAERAQRLLEALDLVGDVEKVRLVRVFQGEKGPPGATAVGEFHYAIDRVVAGGGGRRSDRGDRPGGDRGGRGGGDRGGGGRGGGGGDRGGMGGGERGPPKPRGLSSFKAGAVTERKEDDRARPGEVPRAGMGWVLTAAPRDARAERKGGGGGGPRGPRRDRPGGDRPGGRGPGGGGGGPGGDRGRGPRPPGDPGAPGAEQQNVGPGGDGRGRGPGGGGGPGGGPRPEGDRGPRGPRPDGPRGPRPEGQRGPRPPMNTGGGDAVQAPAPQPASTPAPEAAVETSGDK